MRTAQLSDLTVSAEGFGCIEAGRKAGVELTQKEFDVFTNFVR